MRTHKAGIEKHRGLRSGITDIRLKPGFGKFRVSGNSDERRGLIVRVEPDRKRHHSAS